MWLTWLTALLIVGGFAVLFGLIQLIRRHQRAEAGRAEAVAERASELGLRAVDRPKHALEDFKLLSGGARNIKRAFQGKIDGRSISVIEHRYVVSTGQTTSVIHHEAAVTPVPKAWPKIVLKPKNMFTRLGARMGLRGVEVEDDRFNERWRVTAKDRSFAELLLTPELQAILRDQPRGRIWHLEHGYLAVMERCSIRAEDMPLLVEDLKRVVAAIPPELELWTPDITSSTARP